MKKRIDIITSQPEACKAMSTMENYDHDHSHHQFLEQIVYHGSKTPTGLI